MPCCFSPIADDEHSKKCTYCKNDLNDFYVVYMNKDYHMVCYKLIKKVNHRVQNSYMT